MRIILIFVMDPIAIRLVSHGSPADVVLCVTDVSMSWASDLLLFHCESDEGSKGQHIWVSSGDRTVRRIERCIRQSAKAVAPAMEED